MAVSQRPWLSAGPRFGALHAVAFAGLGVTLPFLPVWLETRGLAAAEIGVVLALPPLVRIVVAAPLMSLVDRGFAERALLVGAHLGVALAYAGLTFAHDPLVIGTIVVLSAVANAPIVPTSDLVTLQAIRRDARLNYGRVRLWGSIAFLVANVAAGYMFGTIPVDALSGLAAALGLVGAAVAWAAVPRNGQPAQAEPELGKEAAALPARLWLVIAAAALTQASHAAVYAFGSIHWRDLDYSSAVIGYLWAIGVAAEIVVFAAFGRHVGGTALALGLLATGSAAAMVRFAVMSLDPPLGAAFFLQALHGVTFGATHLGTMAALALLAPPAARGRAQGLLSSTQAFTTASATVVSGVVFRSAGPLVFLAMVPLAACGLVLALLSAGPADAQPQRERGGG
jgi:PPP family 3-phenylpropionic acid transporter